MVNVVFKGRAARAARRKLPPNFETDEVKRAPHVLVFKRGITGKDPFHFIPSSSSH